MSAEEKTTAPGAQKLTTSHERLLQSIWDHSLDARLLTAPGGRLLAANPAACCLCDRTEAELCRLGRDGLLDLSAPSLATVLAEPERTGQARRELSFIRPDGRRFVRRLFDFAGFAKTVARIDVDEVALHGSPGGCTS